jgi:hypothetical protein
MKGCNSLINGQKKDLEQVTSKGMTLLHDSLETFLEKASIASDIGRIDETKYFCINILKIGCQNKSNPSKNHSPENNFVHFQTRRQKSLPIMPRNACPDGSLKASLPRNDCTYKLIALILEIGR